MVPKKTPPTPRPLPFEPLPRTDVWMLWGHNTLVDGESTISAKNVRGNEELDDGRENDSKDFSIAETQPTDSGNSPGTTSLERRACRICQSETGDMVRPCGCSGTMGDIHEHCLSKWVATANEPNACEICKENYAKDGWVYKPIKDWTKPKFVLRDVVSLFCLAGLVFSIFYLVLLFVERQTYDRCFRMGLSLRGDDFTRLCLIIIYMSCTFGLLASYVNNGKVYLHKQRHVKFVNKQKL